MTGSFKLRAERLLFLSLLCLLSMVSACVQGHNSFHHANYYQDMGQETIEQQINSLEAAVAEDPFNTETSETYYYLALLYSHYNNPSPDYPRSLDLFEQYLLLNPDSQKKDEVQYLQTLLQQLVKTNETLTLKNDEEAKLQQKNKKLKNSYKTLVAENQDLKEAIEKLKLLDFSLETKRLKY